jgi:hypothetical protein
MKSKSLAFAVLSTRCSHRTAAGRQCRRLSADAHSGLCNHHRAVQKQKEAEDLSDALLARSQNFQTAQGINFALANIYRLLAANRISTRRASVLAFINSLLLRTLPAIDYDHATGHIDPTVPKKLKSAAGPSTTDEAVDTEDDEEDHDDENVDENANEDVEEVYKDEDGDAEEECATAPSTNTFTKSTPGWDASIPEPDPAKKPS